LGGRGEPKPKKEKKRKEKRSRISERDVQVEKRPIRTNERVTTNCCVVVGRPVTAPQLAGAK
jgi:hypothetical protein